MNKMIIVLVLVLFSGCTFVENTVDKKKEQAKEKAECKIIKKQNVVLDKKVKALQNKLEDCIRIKELECH